MFLKKTVDGVLAGFQKTVNDLREIQKSRIVEVNKIDEQIVSLRAEQITASSEAARASTIADKLERLISG